MQNKHQSAFLSPFLWSATQLRSAYLYKLTELQISYDNLTQYNIYVIQSG